ncbi:MAG: hypothetical protein RIS36_333 [Pseudomonadota bacterium]|jgi:hypothetical protein
MELPRLAAKQKRYRDVLHYVTTEHVDPLTKSSILATLENYRAALAVCWRAQGGSPEDVLRVATLERQLDALSGSARLRTMAP